MSKKSDKTVSELKQTGKSLSKEEKKQLKAEKKQRKKEAIAALSPKERKKRNLKIAIKVIVIILAILAVVYFAGMFVLQLLMGSKEPVKQIDEQYTTYNFAAVPAIERWKDIDIFKDPEYQALDHNPSFTSSSIGGTFLLKDIPEADKTEAHKFFEKYFSMLQKGNYDIYPSLFSKKYRENPNGFEKDVNRQFPPQMIYDIKVREHARQAVAIDKKNCILGLYEVSFLIHKNDGLFRSDIGRDIELGQDVARPLFFELLTENPGTANEKTVINNLYTESSILSQKEE